MTHYTISTEGIYYSLNKQSLFSPKDCNGYLYWTKQEKIDEFYKMMGQPLLTKTGKPRTNTPHKTVKELEEAISDLRCKLVIEPFFARKAMWATAISQLRQVEEDTKSRNAERRLEAERLEAEKRRREAEAKKTVVRTFILPRCPTVIESVQQQNEEFVYVKKSEWEALLALKEKQQPAAPAEPKPKKAPKPFKHSANLAEFKPSENRTYKHEIHADFKVKEGKRAEASDDAAINARRAYQRQRYQMIYAAKNKEKLEKKKAIAAEIMEPI